MIDFIIGMIFGAILLMIVTVLIKEGKKEREE